MNCTRSLLLCLALAGATPSDAAEETKKEPKKELPQITGVMPFGIVSGITNKIKIVGLNLTNATEVLLPSADSRLAIEIKSRGKASTPDKADAKKLGDTQIEANLFVPSDIAPMDLPIFVRTPEGDSKTNLLRVIEREWLFDEKEPNPGFRKPNEIKLPQTIRGSIDPAGDVDVFRFTAKAGERVRLETLSTSYGSPLDPVLTVYDAKGHVVANSDDTKAGRDALLRFAPAGDGVFFISIIDAHDRGGGAYGYVLNIALE